MSREPSLFDDMPAPEPYPDGAGYKEHTTSKEAAATVDAETLRGLVLAHIVDAGDCTADECAYALGLSVLSIRPRFSELRKKGLIDDSGERRNNDSGKRAIVWRRI